MMVVLPKVIVIVYGYTDSLVSMRYTLVLLLHVQYEVRKCTLLRAGQYLVRTLFMIGKFRKLLFLGTSHYIA